jgi:hypothetical protein
MTRDEVLPIFLEFEGLTIVLADEVGNSGFCEPDACEEGRREGPFELFGRGVDEVNSFVRC